MNDITFFYANIRSLKANYDSLLNFISNRDNEIRYHFLILSESWISDTDIYKYPLHNYTLFVQDREAKSGGVAVYIRNGLNFEIEFVAAVTFNAIKFTVKYSENVVIDYLAVYRFLTGKLKDFYDEFERVIDNLGSTAFIIGDMNIDLLEHSKSLAYRGIIESLGFSQLVEEPTRICESRSSCIDHISVRNIDNILSKTNFSIAKADVSFSDHRVMEAMIEFEPTHLPLSSNVPFTDSIVGGDEQIRVTDWGAVSDALFSISWEGLDAAPDVDTAFRDFIDSLNLLISEHTSTKIISRRGQKRKPWASSNLIDLVKKKEKAYRAFKKNPSNPYLKADFRSLTNMVKRQTKIDKTHYFDEKLAECGVNTKKYWALINKITGRCRVPPASIVTDDGTISSLIDPKRLTEAFNSHFLDSVMGVRDSPVFDSVSVDTAKEYRKTKNNINSLYCDVVSETEVFSIILGLPNKDNCTHDGIGLKFIRENAAPLSIPIATLINRSLTDGIFPDCLKCALVVPVHKGGAKNLMSNYRPIAILSALSKIFEKIINKRLTKFLQYTNFFSDGQFGFREGLSTDDAIFSKLKTIVSGLESKKKVGVAQLDITRAFDSVDHSILMDKLESLGVRGALLNWFGTFLGGRKQAVKLCGEISDFRALSCGVPQGSCSERLVV